MVECWLKAGLHYDSFCDHSRNFEWMNFEEFVRNASSPTKILYVTSSLKLRINKFTYGKFATVITETLIYYKPTFKSMNFI